MPIYFSNIAFVDTSQEITNFPMFFNSFQLPSLMNTDKKEQSVLKIVVTGDKLLTVGNDV